MSIAESVEGLVAILLLDSNGDSALSGLRAPRGMEWNMMGWQRNGFICRGFADCFGKVSLDVHNLRDSSEPFHRGYESRVGMR